MITITRSLARRLRLVFSRALGVSTRGNTPRIQFRTRGTGLSIGVTGHDAAVTYDHPYEVTVTPFSVPFELLRRCEGTKDEPVCIDREGDEIVARWADAGIPQIARFPVGESKDELPLPEAMRTNDADELLTALRNAVETTDREAARYVLNCIRLRGSGGQIAGTDGRQLFVQNGLSFPWEGELIVFASRVFTCPDLSTGGSVEIGCTDDWAVVRSGPWTVHLRIEKAGRFPNVDSCIPQPSRTVSTLRMSGSDAEFLKKALRRIPVGDEVNSPVTVELNGSVAIRAKSPEQPAPTEVILTGSRRDGDTLRFNTNREYLSRAVRLGFQDVEFGGSESPACCRKGNRIYVWSLLSKEGAILSDPNAERIESPAERRTVTRVSQRTNGRSRTPDPRPSRSAHFPETSGLRNPASLVEEAEALRAALQATLRRTNDLVAALNRHLQPEQRRPAPGSSRTLQGNAA